MDVQALLTNPNIGLPGEPTIPEAYQALKKNWKHSAFDREIGLHLLYFSWLGMVEPSHLTGFAEGEPTISELEATFLELLEAFELYLEDDPEVIFVFGLTANMFWMMFEDYTRLRKLGGEYQKRYRSLMPNRLNPAIFDGRGCYGEYYSSQVAIKDGF